MGHLRSSLRETYVPSLDGAPSIARGSSSLDGAPSIVRVIDEVDEYPSVSAALPPIVHWLSFMLEFT